jgi:H/ACA ribonucleoprotein complex subunit 4
MSLRPPPAERSVADLLTFGVVPLDKPPGPSSHQVSGWLRDAVDDALASADAGVGIDRAAHAGTLDPKVTGCLPVLLGDATRLAQATLGRKEYVAVLECHATVPEDVARVAAEFEGEVIQKPPKRSAVARRLRTREIHDLTVLEAEQRRALLSITCESGTYVRKLCHDLGLALGTGAHMGALRRTATTPFDDADLVSSTDFVDALAFWTEDGDTGPLRETVLPAERALSHLPTVVVAPSAAREVAEGAPVYAPGVVDADDAARAAAPEDLVVCETPDGSAVCLGRVVGDLDGDAGVAVELERVLV